MRLPKRQHKYRAKPTTVDGIRFASQKEARRYRELKLLEKAGEIEGLDLQPRYPLRVLLAGGKGATLGNAVEAGASPYPCIGTYVADFAYRDKRTGRMVIEDCKGFKTPLYRWKKKHVEAQYGIQILET